MGLGAQKIAGFEKPARCLCCVTSDLLSLVVKASALNNEKSLKSLLTPLILIDDFMFHVVAKL